MPLDYDPPQHLQTVSSPVGGPSAVISISGLVCSVCRGDLEIDAQVVDEINGFWGDGYGVLTELTALAHATGRIADTEIDPFLERLLDPVEFAAPLPFETETPDERDAANARLARLSGDADLRRRYVATLRDLWGLIEPTWHSDAVPRALAAQQQWRERLQSGEDVLSLFPPEHLVRRLTPFGDMTRRAHEDGTLRITPVLTRPHIIALPGFLSVSLQITDEDPVVSRRKEADVIAKRLRPLSDATRITMLAQLAVAPSSVSDLARTLHIAQPTASVHLRQLREAGLVSVTRSGSRTTYRVEPHALSELLSDVGHRLEQQVTTP